MARQPFRAEPKDTPTRRVAGNPPVETVKLTEVRRAGEHRAPTRRASNGGRSSHEPGYLGHMGSPGRRGLFVLAGPFPSRRVRHRGGRLQASTGRGRGLDRAPRPVLCRRRGGPFLAAVDVQELRNPVRRAVAKGHPLFLVARAPKRAGAVSAEERSVSHRCRRDRRSRRRGRRSVFHSKRPARCSRASGARPRTRESGCSFPRGCSLAGAVVCSPSTSFVGVRPADRHCGATRLAASSSSSLSPAVAVLIAVSARSFQSTSQSGSSVRTTTITSTCTGKRSPIGDRPRAYG